MSDKAFLKGDIDHYLFEVAKEYKRRNGRRALPVEVVLIGGAAAILNYGFRKSTNDVDMLTQAESSVKEAINAVGDRFDLPNGWMNADFTKTDSYTPKIVNYAQFYRTFCRVLEVRTMTGPYLLAMKLKSFRGYAHDRSDVIGILLEHEKRGEPLTLEQIRDAVIKLYGSYDALSEEARTFLEQALALGDYAARYETVKRTETENKDILLRFQDDHPGVTTSDNVNEILASVREKRRQTP